MKGIKSFRKNSLIQVEVKFHIPYSGLLHFDGLADGFYTNESELNIAQALPLVMVRMKIKAFCFLVAWFSASLGLSGFPCVPWIFLRSQHLMF